MLKSRWLLLGAAFIVATRGLAADVPERLMDQEFWALAESLSESGAPFGTSENLVSNESDLAIMAGLLKRGSVPGVLIGVGPEQNFSYIAAARPKMAFIVDIRRENRDLHLLYKALFDLSKDRAEFLGRLVSRSRPTGASVKELFTSLDALPRDIELRDSTLALVRQDLVERHGFSLTDQDLQWIDHVLMAFYNDGPTINWWRSTPTPRVDFQSLMTTPAPSGIGNSFLANEYDFQFVKGLQEKNLVVPIVGDFAGTHALPGVADYIRTHKADVPVFYGSNVDDFLKPDQLIVFCVNLRLMPVGRQGIYLGGSSRGLGLGGYHPYSAVLDSCAAH